MTGLGLITAAGRGVKENWHRVTTSSAPSGVRKPPELHDLPCDFMYLVGDGVQESFDVGEQRLLDRFSQLAVLAAREAVADAGLLPSAWEGDRVAVVIGTANGGFVYQGEQQRVLLERGPRRVSPMTAALTTTNCAAASVCRDLRAVGPSFGLNTTCSSGTDAIGLARELLRAGLCDVAIAGGTESVCSRLLVAGMCKLKGLSTRRDDPAAACRPFDVDRDGFVIGEGAGILVLERPEHARARGARVRAQVVGYGASNDAYAPVAPHPEGAGAERALRAAMADARVCGADVGHVNAHGTSTPVNDLVESAMLHRVLGAHPLVTSTKAMTGHTLGAAGGIETAFAVLALQHQLVPPTANLESPDPRIAVETVRKEARPARLDCVVKTSLGFGGHNAALVLTRG
ncbi:beta-ketoacyl-[acyl-carrier-protein] synthase family protein [Streptomyces pinistramenti]|uniref:beta-ketoacyl-[acyl-carrier-protein] synthase family protein n=1 Tax=Streptomyces pinistramenti TaxID=2884812 RepID=UPI0027E3B6DD|nr:beta-ketoacyl-[acyl-carrier-protein] synthase family protein [Streptomyces pinistramenti]